MSSIFNGLTLHLSIFGQSHSEAIGMTLDGLPAGIPVELDRLQKFSPSSGTERLVYPPA